MKILHWSAATEKKSPDTPLMYRYYIEENFINFDSLVDTTFRENGPADMLPIQWRSSKCFMGGDIDIFSPNLRTFSTKLNEK